MEVVRVSKKDRRGIEEGSKKGGGRELKNGMKIEFFYILRCYRSTPLKRGRLARWMGIMGRMGIVNGNWIDTIEGIDAIEVGQEGDCGREGCF